MAIGIGGACDDSANYQNPAGGATNMTLTMGDDEYHLIIDPNAAFTTGTVNITTCANPIAGQLLNIRTTLNCPSFTITPNTGQGINPNPFPVVLAAGKAVDLIFSAFNTWYYSS